MTFEMFGAGCFGAVIGFVAWHVFRVGEASLDVKKLAAFIGALLGAVVLAAFPTGTSLFAAYSIGLAFGFFLVPASRIVVAGYSAAWKAPVTTYFEESGNLASQLKYIEEHWPVVERVVKSALDQNGRVIREYHLVSLPLDESGRIAALKRYARTYPELASIRREFLGYTLRLREA